MLSLAPIFVAAALLQCVPTNGHIIAESKKDMDNQLVPHALPSPKRKGFHQFVRIPQPLQTTRTDSGVVAECMVSGNPPPSVVWLKNGIPVADYEEETNEIRSTSPVAFATLISKLVVPSAVLGDVFTCVGVSELKETSASIMNEEDVDSNVLPAITKPIITEYYTDVFQNQGTSITLPCRVSSVSDYQVVWQHNQENIVFSNAKIRVLPSGDLRIYDLAWEDMGSYTCTAKNMYGKDAASTFLYPTKP